MKLKSPLVDVVSASALIGMVVASAFAQVQGPDPKPLTHTCDGFTEFRFDGQQITIDPWECPVGQACLEIRIYDSEGRIIGAAGGCSIVS